MKRRLSLFALLALLCAACLEPPREAAYATHAFIYQPLEAFDQTALQPYDHLVIESTAFPGLDSTLYARTLLYLDIWATGYRTAPSWQWQPSPTDIGQAHRTLEFTPGRAVYVYDWTDRQQPDRFAAWCRAALAKGVAGLFLDDWGADKFFWIGADSIKRAIWPSYPSNAILWQDIQRAEREVALAFAVPIVCNGPGPMLPSTVQMHEGVGSGRESWDRLTVEGVDAMRYLFDGRRHWLEINGLDREGNPTPAGLANLQRAVDCALKAPGLISIGLAYAEPPAQGGSVYQLPPTTWADPRNWPGYWKP